MLLESNGDREIIEYSRKNYSEQYKYCDLNRPDEFNFFYVIQNINCLIF